MKSCVRRSKAIKFPTQSDQVSDAKRSSFRRKAIKIPLESDHGFLRWVWDTNKLPPVSVKQSRQALVAGRPSEFRPNAFAAFFRLVLALCRS
jgi:hypothetical protein